MVDQGQNESDGRRGQTLVGAARGQTWPTPGATDGDKAPKHYSRGPSNPSLPTSAKSWPTPAERDYKGPNGPAHFAREGKKNHIDQLPNAVSQFSLPGLESSKNGAGSSESTRRLNPRFVEMLMGMPPGWTHADCALPATELSRWQRLMRSSLYILLSTTARAFNEKCTHRPK